MGEPNEPPKPEQLPLMDLPSAVNDAAVRATNEGGRMAKLIATFNPPGDVSSHYKPHYIYHVLRQVKALAEAAPEDLQTQAGIVLTSIKQFEDYNAEGRPDTEKDWALHVRKDRRSAKFISMAQKMLGEMQEAVESKATPASLVEAYQADEAAGRSGYFPALSNLAKEALPLPGYKMLADHLHEIHATYEGLPEGRKVLGTTQQEFQQRVREVLSGFEKFYPEHGLRKELAAIEKFPTREKIKQLSDTLHAQCMDFHQQYYKCLDEAIASDVPESQPEAAQGALSALTATRQWAALVPIADRRLTAHCLVH